MRKFALSLCMWLAMAIPAFAAMDSTALSDPRIMGVNIDQGSSDRIPVGTVIAWPVATNPEDAES